MEQKIKINIAGRLYPLTVKHEEEEVLRSAAKDVGKMIALFEEKYNVHDKQDVLAMCALQLASKVEMQKRKISAMEHDFSKSLQELDHSLEEIVDMNTK